MTSGEWDLRALKALEEEEQKEFLALSQRNLFEPPEPPGGTAIAPATAASVSSKPALTYAQLHPHLLKLPTIDECQLIAAAKRQNSSNSSTAGSTRLKFTRALSLSAHSLSPRVGGGGGFGKKLKARLVGAKSSGSLSPARHSYSVSPVYTPPPIRRCATLHHTQPVRKTFKTLQQLERQKQERRQQQQQLQQQQQNQQQQPQHLASAATPQLQRIAGTNKTYWKYGANSTAASIIGQRARLQLPNDLESTTSDELNSETEFVGQQDDSATETGSCSVPLPANDSNELLRLMFTAASSAVTAAQTAPAATGGTTPIAAALAPPSRHCYQGPAVKDDSETVAYEAFHTALANRHKSFALLNGSRTLLRGSSLTAQESPSCVKTQPTTAVGNRKMLKSTSMDATAGEYQQLGSKPSMGTASGGQIATNQLCGAAQTKVTDDVNGLHFNEHQTNEARYQQQEQQEHAAAAYQHQLELQACYSHGAVIDDELEQHIKHCSCSCNHMGYGNSMDYQTTGFGGLPDVTEHSNIRRTLSRQNSISNSDSGGEIASIQKSKVNFGSSGIVVGGGVGGIVAALDAKSPTSLSTATASAGTGGGGSGKNKSARKANAAHKSKRGSWLVALTLVSAICLLAIAATLAYQHFLMAPSRNSHAQRLRIVRRILREVPLVDGHNNFAWNVRKYAHSSLELVHLSHDLDHKALWARPTWAQTDMERLKQGLVGVQVWSAYVPCEAQGLDAVQLALEQIDIVRRLSDMYAQETVLVTSSQDIVAAHRRGLLASLIGIEGGHTIGSSLGVLRSFYSLGARYLSLTHRCDVSWAGSSASPLEQGLSQFGKAIVREMNRLGMMIDLSHSSDATARDVLQVTRAPVIFSHSAARQLCNSTRNVPDDILRLVAENGGLIMLSFDSEDVACGRQARLQDVIEHIKYVRAIAGIQHIGLGAGYDGIEQPPLGLEDVSKYPDLLAALLEDHNWSEEDIAMLAGKNFLRIMETVENVRDYWKRAAIQPIEQTEPQPKTQCTYMSS
ncbi:uncharacterized protein LOC115622279 [Scaptodrosophila lebanonensis]|uniref:Dipeptidase n=1 Tax=Drosophila lebanonensis TaxID=7225 RepID=A0A6J2T529_DROLE|nr:uncharacterized protein LOC115622279 [Scaptodrosophila lebanonensis]